MVAIAEPITDLKLLSNSLIGNPEILAKVRQKKSLELTVGTLLEKLDTLPTSLLVFGEETTVFRFFIKDNEIQCTTLKMYIDDEDDNIKIFSAGSPTKPVSDRGFKFLCYKTGFSGYQQVQLIDDPGSIISIPISINAEYEQKLKNEYEPDLIEEKSGLVPASILKYRPRNTVKLKELKPNTVYRVLDYLGTSKTYNSKRYSMQQVQDNQLIGEAFESYSNSSLNKIIEKSTLPVDVVVTGIKDNPRGEGVIVTFALAKLAKLKI